MKKILGTLALLGLLSTSAIAANVNLAWNYTQGPVAATRFVMYRSTACSAPWTTLSSTIPVTTFTFTDTTAVEGSTYCYDVTAFSAANVESADSNLLTYTVPSTKPNPPTSLRVTP